MTTKRFSRNLGREEGFLIQKTGIEIKVNVLEIFGSGQNKGTQLAVYQGEKYSEPMLAPTASVVRINDEVLVGLEQKKNLGRKVRLYCDYEQSYTVEPWSFVDG